jgi:hypothetical protein
MARPISEFERELRVLEAELKRLEAEYNQFFAGRLPRLPWEQRTRVEAMMKRFDRMVIQNTGDRFRFQTVQARWAAFNELWERQLKAQEMGRRPVRARGAAVPPPVAPPPVEPARPASPRDGVVASTSISDPGAQAERIQALYQEVSRARQAAGEKPLEFDRFAAVVQAQVKKLGEGRREVAFEVAMKEGKVTLTANPVKD